MTGSCMSGCNCLPSFACGSIGACRLGSRRYRGRTPSSNVVWGLRLRRAGKGLALSSLPCCLPPNQKCRRPDCIFPELTHGAFPANGLRGCSAGCSFVRFASLVLIRTAIRLRVTSPDWIGAPRRQGALLQAGRCHAEPAQEWLGCQALRRADPATRQLAANLPKIARKTFHPASGLRCNVFHLAAPGNGCGKFRTTLLSRAGAAASEI
jgi:hypothetical protein